MMIKMKYVFHVQYAIQLLRPFWSAGRHTYRIEFQQLFIDFQDNKGISISKQTPTAIYSALLNYQGECLFGMGDMTIHNEILPEHVEEQGETIEKASFVLLDGNVPVKTMTKVFQMCCQFSVPGNVLPLLLYS